MRVALFHLLPLTLLLSACGNGSPESRAGTQAPEDEAISAAPGQIRDELGAYSPASAAGDLVFLSAILPPAGEDGAVPGDVESQTGAALTVLEEVLRDEGLGYQDLAFVKVLIVAQDGMIDTEGFTRAWQRTFGTRLQPHAPARSIAGIAALPRAGALVAIEAVARPSRPAEEETQTR